VPTPGSTPGAADFAGLADDLQAAWNAPGVTMRTRQRLLRALVADIIADVDEVAREVILTIHWRGGQHSQLRVRKPKTGEHGCRTPEEALAVMRSMATRWSDADIAASLNRMGMPTGQGKTWTAHRVSSLRRVHGIHAYRSAEKNGEWLTMSEAAATLGVTNHQIRRLIKDRILAAEQVVPGAPYQIRASDLQDERVLAAIRRTGRPRRSDPGRPASAALCSAITASRSASMRRSMAISSAGFGGAVSMA
jgi:excisionase family DNA binding protein